MIKVSVLGEFEKSLFERCELREANLFDYERLFENFRLRKMYEIDEAYILNVKFIWDL